MKIKRIRVCIFASLIISKGPERGNIVCCCVYHNVVSRYVKLESLSDFQQPPTVLIFLRTESDALTLSTIYLEFLIYLRIACAEHSEQ